MFIKRSAEQPEENVAAREFTPEEKHKLERAEQVRESYKSLQNSVKQFLHAAFRITLEEDALKELTNKLRAVINSYVTDVSEERLKKILGDMVLTNEEKAKMEKGKK